MERLIFFAKLYYISFESVLPNFTTEGILLKVWDVKRSNSLKIMTKMMQILLKITPQSLCSNLNCLQKMLIKWVKMTSGLTMPKSYWMFTVRTKMWNIWQSPMLPSKIYLKVNLTYFSLDRLFKGDLIWGHGFNIFKELLIILFDALDY